MGCIMIAVCEMLLNDADYFERAAKTLFLATIKFLFNESAIFSQLPTNPSLDVIFL